MDRKARLATNAVSTSHAEEVQFEGKLRSAVAQPTHSYAEAVKETCSKNKNIILKQVQSNLTE